MRLALNTLHALPERVAVPHYHRGSLRAGIVHFGVGNFHRAHQASYLDRLFSRGLDRDWAVVGAGVMPAEDRIRRILLGQDCLSLLVTRSAERSDARIIGSIVDFLPIGDASAIVARLADPAIRIVSLTVTEGGYFLDADGRFDLGNPAILHDAMDLARPRTVFAMMLSALRKRRAAGVAPFTVMSCDNLPHNGRLTRGAMTGLARLQDPAFADWVDGTVAFPNGMVDRITPATSDRERRLAREEFGVADDWPVFAEDFAQWVLEDDFPGGRPELEAVGVTFVDDVTSFEELKLRVLNGSHAMIAYPAALMGIGFAHQAVVHPLIRPVLERIQRREVLPAVRPVPGMAPDRYLDTVLTRFANPNIADTIARLCFDGANRQPKFVVPSIRAALEQELPIDGLALASALWCRYCAGDREDGTPIISDDPQRDRLRALAVAARSEPGCWLDQPDVYGVVGSHPRFRRAFSAALTRLYDLGVRTTLTSFAAA